MGRVSEAELEQAGGLGNYVKSLTERLRTGNMELKERSAATLSALADQLIDNARAIGKLETVRPLVSLVLDGSPVAQEHAAACLSCLARASAECQLEIINRGAITPLAAILRSGGGSAQEAAAAAFASISDHEEAQKTMMKLGCIPTMVDLLKRGSSVAQVNASQALANLAGLNVQGQTEVHQAGAVKYLLHLLGSGRGQEFAARAIARLACRNGIIQADVCKRGGIAKLLALLSDRNIQAQIQAADALAELAQGSNGLGHRRTQDAISKAGGICPLLGMVECIPVVHRVIASSVKCLAEIARRNRANQDTIASMGGLRPICELLQSGSNPETVQANAALAVTEICRSNAENQNSVAEVGGIGQMVVLLRHSGKASVEAEVAGAMWTISVNNSAIKLSIAAAGAVDTLCKLLNAQSERAQVHAANALASLALGHPANMVLMAPRLVELLGNPNEGTQKRAAKALWRIVKENPDDAAHIAKAGGAEQLVRLLREGSAGAKKYSLWSLSLSIDKSMQGEPPRSIQTIVMETGGVTPLVTSLCSDNRTVTMQAAAALARLALDNKNAQVEIARSGGISPLVTLLDRFESEGTQEHAAAALAELALIPLTKRAIDQAGGISPLVSLLLYDGAMTSKKYAAAALARLSIEGNQNLTDAQLQAAAKKEKALRTAGQLGPSKAQQIAEAGAISPLVSLLSGGRGADAQEAAAFALWALAGDSGNRLNITESGGICPLVLLLGCDNPKAREHAEAALVRLSIEIANREIIIKQLVSMLSDSGSEAAQEQAAAALANLARDSTDNRTSIVDAGGIVPLLALLESNSQKAKENAASALTQLCATRANQDAIAEAGGIQLLVGVLASSSSNVKETSAVTLCSLAACAIWELSKNHRANQLAVAEAGAINPLVSMLGSPSAEMQSNAAGALSTLAQNNHENQTGIARTGAIAPLCTLVREGSSETKEQSASALWALAHENAPNKATIAKLGGVEPLVGLLVSGASERSQEFAAGALASLASKHSENRANIAKRLVGLLNGRAVERAVRVLSAISSLSSDHPANQLAIAKMGGVPSVISWLSSASEEAQREAARAVLSVAMNNATTQVIFAWTPLPFFRSPLLRRPQPFSRLAGTHIKVGWHPSVDNDNLEVVC